VSEFTRSFYEEASDGEIDYPEDRLPSLSVETSEEPGIYGDIQGSTDYDETGNYLTGLCLLAPGVLEEKDIKNYEELKELLFEESPELATLTDQWGLVGADGNLAVTIEDEEWTKKLSDYLSNKGISYEESRLEKDVKRAYTKQLDRFNTYVNDVLDCDIDLNEVYTSDYSSQIDQILGAEARNMGTDVPEKDWTAQRIRMYFDPAWAKFVENQLDWSRGSTDFVEPLRFFEQLYDGQPFSIFSDKERSYWSQGNPEYGIKFVAPLLDPYGTGSQKAGTKESETDINTSNWKDFFDSIDKSERNLAKSSLFRLSTGFPKREEAINEIIDSREKITDRKPIWKNEAQSKGLEGREIGEFFQEKKDQIWGNKWRELEKAIEEDLKTLFENQGETA